MELWQGTIEYGMLCPRCTCVMRVQVMPSAIVKDCDHCGFTKFQPTRPEQLPTTLPFSGLGGYERPLDAATGIIRGLVIGAAGWAFLWWYFR